jgi:hypothetical protein
MYIDPDTGRLVMGSRAKSNSSMVSLPVMPSFEATAGSDYMKKYFEDEAQKNALSELKSKGISDIASVSEMSGDDFADMGISLETQNWAKNNLSNPGFFKRNAATISGFADVVGAGASLLGTLDNMKTAKKQRSMMDMQMSNLKEDRARFDKIAKGFNARAANRSAFVS